MSDSLNGLLCGLSEARINKLRAAAGKPPIPSANLAGRSVSWSHKSNGQTFFFSGVIVEIIDPTPDDPSDTQRKWWNARSAYKIKMPGEGKSAHPRAVVFLDSGKGYRMPNMNRLTFRTDDDGARQSKSDDHPPRQ